MLIALICLYFLPSFIALVRWHDDLIPILLFNLIAGWTIIGWFAMFIWSILDWKKIMILFPVFRSIDNSYSILCGIFSSDVIAQEFIDKQQESIREEFWKPLSFYEMNRPIPFYNWKKFMSKDRKVYLVYKTRGHIGLTKDYVCGVFSSEEKAKAFRAEYNPVDYYIVARSLDIPFTF